MKLTYIVNKCLDNLHTEADNREDGNTCALLDKIRRDVASLQPHYHDLDIPVENAYEEDPSALVAEETSDVSYDYANKVTTSDANNPEEKPTGSTKLGKGYKSNA